MFPVIRKNSLAAPMAVVPGNRLDSFFDNVFGNDGGSTSRSWAGAPVAMWEDEDSISIEVEMPGVAESDVDVTFHNGMLFIRWERKPAEGRRHLFDGRSYGRFERVITLPEAVNTDDVRAGLADGVLSLTLPKSPEARPKKIAIKTG